MDDAVGVEVLQAVSHADEVLQQALTGYLPACKGERGMGEKGMGEKGKRRGECFSAHRGTAATIHTKGVLQQMVASSLPACTGEGVRRSGR